MSVVSELRALADELDVRAERYAQNPDVMSVFRECAQRARLRALRAETSVLARTDERPRFAQLKAPQRSSPPLVGTIRLTAMGAATVLAAMDAEPQPLPPALVEFTYSGSRLRAAEQIAEPLPQNCERYRCAVCKTQGIWHRGILTPPLPQVRLCNSCREKAGPCARCGHAFAGPRPVRLWRR